MPLKLLASIAQKKPPAQSAYKRHNKLSAGAALLPGLLLLLQMRCKFRAVVIHKYYIAFAVHSALGSAGAFLRSV